MGQTKVLGSLSMPVALKHLHFNGEKKKKQILLQKKSNCARKTRFNSEMWSKRRIQRYTCSYTNV